MLSEAAISLQKTEVVLLIQYASQPCSHSKTDKLQYIVCLLGRSRQATPSISKTLNPEWKICFDMPLNDVPLLEVACWDKDRFKKDYMGEFDIAVEDIFEHGQISTEPKWFKLKSKRKGGKKKNEVSGDIQMQFSLVDSANPAASPEEIQKKFRSVMKLADEDDDLSRTSTNPDDDEDHDDEGDDDEIDLDDDVEANENDNETTFKPKTDKKKRLARLRRKSIAVRAYDFLTSDIAGIIFMEIVKVTDLPPERNMTRTSFDMDPFVVAALGRKVLRTKMIRHNLNPIYNEKMLFQVMRHETGYSLTFTVIDKDSLSGNDFIASALFPINKMIEKAPIQDPETGLYSLPEPPEFSPQAQKKEGKSRFRLPLSRTSSAQSITKLARPGAKYNDSALSVKNGDSPEYSKLTPTSSPEAARLAPTSSPEMSRPTPTSAPTTINS